MTQAVEPGVTISCKEVVDLVTDYLEGVIDEPTRVEFEAHLRLCAGCAEYLKQMRLALRAVGYVPLHSLSDTTKAELLEAFRDVAGRAL
jgi:predicted anti-sigma-YlaC factor YlaD